MVAVVVLFSVSSELTLEKELWFVDWLMDRIEGSSASEKKVGEARIKKELYEKEGAPRGWGVGGRGCGVGLVVGGGGRGWVKVLVCSL